MGVFLVALGLYYTLPGALPTGARGWPRLIASIILFATLLFTLWHLVFGTSLHSLTRKLEIKISHALELALRRQFLRE